jgi:hypothetical protein
VSYYKGERLGKKAPCAICAGPGQGPRDVLRLAYGVGVMLCAFHRSHDFLTRRAGRDLVVSLGCVWDAAGCLTKARQRALTAFLTSIRPAPSPPLPGSYAWPDLRREIETLFAKGRSVPRVAEDLHRAWTAPHARPPSIRTLQRWFHEGRWRQHPGGSGGAPSSPPSAPPPLLSVPPVARETSPGRPGLDEPYGDHPPRPPAARSYRRPPPRSHGVRTRSSTSRHSRGPPTDSRRRSRRSAASVGEVRP